jgi:hypothetical protein
VGRTNEPIELALGEEVSPAPLVRVDDNAGNDSCPRETILSAGALGDLEPPLSMPPPSAAAQIAEQLSPSTPRRGATRGKS